MEVGLRCYKIVWYRSVLVNVYLFSLDETDGCACSTVVCRDVKWSSPSLLPMGRSPLTLLTRGKYMLALRLGLGV